MYTVIFDLDGTISDPAKGITRSINHALVELGHKAHPEDALLQYIGPPLATTFSELAGITNEAALAHAIELYRERYIPIGYKENHIYDDMKHILSTLASKGYALCIATSKRRDIAIKVLEFLNIDAYFTQIHGCDVDRSKSDLLREILSDPILGNNALVMIGDRDIDFLAAAEVNMPSIAVRWGYGNDREFELATETVSNPLDLPNAIERIAQQSTTKKQ